MPPRAWILGRIGGDGRNLSWHLKWLSVSSARSRQPKKKVLYTVTLYSKLLYTVTLCSKFTRVLTSGNFGQAPVVVFAAMGTLDGFGKVVLNLPRILDYQIRYASRLMQQGSGGVVSNDALDVFRAKIDESAEYRYNALKLFVKYDTNGDGRLCRYANAK